VDGASAAGAALVRRRLLDRCKGISSGPTHFGVWSCLNQSVCIGPRTANPARTGPVRLGRGVHPAGRPIWPEGRDLAHCRNLLATIFGLKLVKKRQSMTRIKQAQQSGPCRLVRTVHGHQKVQQ
jgi:hypothetical protein